MPFGPRRAVPLTLIAFACACACAAAGSAGTLSAQLKDPSDAPAFVSACAIDTDSSGVFTPMITVMDGRPSPLTGADVAIDFYDSANHVLGTVVTSPPYGPQGLPFGAVDHVACRVKSARFLDGSSYATKDANAPSSLVPIGGAILGIGAAALLISSGHSSSSSGSTATSAPTAGASTGTTPMPATPAPVGTIVQLARPKATPKR